MKVSDILATKGSSVITISPNKSVFDAMDLFVNHHIGAIVVLDDESGSIAGIVSERDALKSAFFTPDKLKELTIAEIMTKKVIVIEPEDNLDYVQTIITQNRIRHLPVFAGTKLVGIISIGDVVKSALKEFQYENKYLMDYISGNLTK